MLRRHAIDMPKLTSVTTAWGDGLYSSTFKNLQRVTIESPFFSPRLQSDTPEVTNIDIPLGFQSVTECNLISCSLTL